jgi:AAA domain
MADRHIEVARAAANGKAASRSHNDPVRPRVMTPDEVRAYNGQPPRVETFSAADLMKMDLPEQRWAVDGVLVEGFTLLAGRPKLGKSWLALNLALAVATGGTALGSIPVEAGDVLFLALEDTRRRLKDRLAKLLLSQQFPAPERLTLAREWPRQDQGGLAAVEEWLVRHKQARLVVLDVWGKFKPPRRIKGEEYAEDYAHGSAVKALAEKHGVNVLALTHCTKMRATDPIEEISGSIGVSGCADSLLVLRRERGQCDASLTVTGRDVEEAELALQWDARFALWSVIGTASDYRVTKDQQEVIDLIKRLKTPLTPAEAATALGKTRNAAKLLLWKMGEKGILQPVSGAYILGNQENHTNQGNQGNRGNRPVSDAIDDGHRHGNQDEDVKTPFD